jgi:TrmH family RNA methyltransferase
MNFRAITSVHNPRVKDAVRLRSARHRAKQQRFLIDGGRELLRAMAAEVPLSDVFICPELCTSPESREVFNLPAAQGADVWEVPEEVFRKLAFGEREDGVVAVAHTKAHTLADLRPRGDGLIAVLESLEKPGNVGAVLRSADAAGVSAVIVADGGTDLYNPNAIRASLGTIFSLPIAAATAAETLEWLRQRGTRVFAARVDATMSYAEAPLGENAAVILGSEAEGVTRVWHAEDVTPIRLPMLGAADSLNVSATAAVLFYEALRQRK